MCRLGLSLGLIHRSFDLVNVPHAILSRKRFVGRSGPSLNKPRPLPALAYHEIDILTESDSSSRYMTPRSSFSHDYIRLPNKAATGEDNFEIITQTNRVLTRAKDVTKVDKASQTDPILTADKATQTDLDPELNIRANCFDNKLIKMGLPVLLFFWVFLLVFNILRLVKVFHA